MPSVDCDDTVNCSRCDGLKMLWSLDFYKCGCFSRCCGCWMRWDRNCGDLMMVSDGFGFLMGFLGANREDGAILPDL